MTSLVIKIDGEGLVNPLVNLSITDQEMQSKAENDEMGYGNHSGICAICLNKTVLQETALVKGCEHAYCVTCILQWASYNNTPTCPQCKNPFEFLDVHRSLDGSIQDYMIKESVCLLLRATWFKPLVVEEHEVVYDDLEDYYPYEDEQDDLDEVFFSISSSLRIGNRRWGDNGYVRAGRQEARPVYRPNLQHSGASSSREYKQKEIAKNTPATGDEQRGLLSAKLQIGRLQQNIRSSSEVGMEPWPLVFSIKSHKT